MNSPVKYIWDIFWSPWFWLPANITWEDIRPNKEGVFYARFTDLENGVYIAVLITIFRYIFERHIFFHLATACGLKKLLGYKQSKTSNGFMGGGSYVQMIPQCKTGYMTEQEVKSSGQNNKLERQLLRQAKAEATVKKFCESGWRFVFYFTMFFTGLYILWDKEWMWESKYHWIGYPYQHVTDSVYWYFMIEYGYYLSSTVLHFFEAKKKDYYEMVLHHVSTLILMTFSYSCNHVRIATTILVIHDAVDYWMELAKMGVYCKFGTFRDTCFGIFVIMWIITRLIIYPYWCLGTVLLELPYAGIYNPKDYVLTGFLIILQILHIIWFYYILKIVMRFITGASRQDSRSDSEDEGDYKKD